MAVAALVLGACGKNQPAGEASPAQPTAPTTPTASATPTPTPEPIKPSNNLDAIKVEGEPLKEPKVTVPAPWAIDQTRTKVLKAGDGATVLENGSVEVNYYGVNGRTGKKFDDSFSRGQAVVFPLDQVVPGFKKGLANQKVGSRVLIAMPGQDAYDQMGGNPQADIQVGDTLVFVADIISTTLSKPEGDPVAAKPGLPTVTDSGGKPKVALPGGQPPSQLVSQPIIQGKGKKVAASDQITVNYQSVAWSTGQVVEETYGKQPQSGPLNKLIAGWQEGLVDKTVGSRILLVVPPDKAYPEGNETPKINKGETLVYVVDILYTEAAQ